MNFGIIYDININTQIFSLREKRGLKFFFIPKSIFKRLKKYLYAGNFISFTVNNTTTVKNNKEISVVKSIKEISVPSNARRIKLYSKNDNSKELASFLETMNNLMFIDLEMSMPDYDEKNHTSELVQASYIITDYKFNVLRKRDFHIIPTLNKAINRRTSEFLHIDYEFLKINGTEYINFYKLFKNDIDEYSPTLVIFGKNDKRFLESSYRINNCESLNSKLRFVNLSQLLKNYYDLINDPGLFKMYEKLYGVLLDEQKHDAYEDAYYTLKVYEKFKEIVGNNIKA